MPPQDDPARGPARRPHADPWAGESPFVGEAVAEEQAPIDPWYEDHTPFAEGRELEETYAPETGRESDLEAESPFQSAFVEGRTGLNEPEELEEGLAAQEGLSFQGPDAQSLLSSQECQKRLKGASVAVVGGGLAGLMAARELGQRGVKVTVFEARSQVGGRVLSNRKFSNGRITEEGAELIGSFHTEWLTLAQKYGLTVISRMNDGLYWRACLRVKLALDVPLTTKEIDDLWKEAETRVLKPIARLASQIRHPSEPWLESGKKQCGQKLYDVQQLDGMSVADALTQCFGVRPSERLWKAMEFLLVNNEVAPLERMNFLGLLCKVKAGQGARCSAVDTGPDERLMGYWEELEIFRSAEGCQELATEIAKEIQTRYGAKILLNTAVTHIALSKQGVVLASRKVVDEAKGNLADKPLPPLPFDYAILAIPPSVWAGVKVTADGKDAHPKDEIGVMGMGPAVKFFSDVKNRFWIKENAAPSGGSLSLGQVWEGTDNQTRAGNQGIVLSVFAGPIIRIPLVAGGADRRAPNPVEFKNGLTQLYSGYTSNLNKTLFRDWPNTPFIKTGYASPRTGEILNIGKKLSEPFRDRLFFAGEHTQMDFFGYMEGALRSGKRAANALMLQSCGLLKKPASASPPMLAASAAPIRAKTASEYETDTLSEVYSSTGYPGEAESLFAGEPEEEWEPRASDLASEGPFLDTIEEFEEPPGSAIVPEVYEEFNEPEAGGFHEEEYETDSEEEHQVLDAYEEEQGTVVEPELGELDSESDHLATEEYVDGEASDNLAADAFVADNDAKRYFVAFPRLGGLAVKKATVLTPSTFEKLMDLMLASNQKNFVIDAHGEPKGLFMPLASGTRISATKHSLFILSGIEHVRSLIRSAKESENIWGRASGTDLDRWRRIVDVLHSKTWQKMVGLDWPTVAPQVSGVDAARSIVQSRINALVDSLFPGRVENKQGRVDRLIEKMLRLRARGIREIQFRACNIGKDPSSLSEFRTFFGADHLCAPDVRSGMGLSPAPTIDRRAVDLLGRDRRTQLFNMPGGRFAIRIIISGLSFSVHCAADTRAALGEWVAGHVMANSTYRGGPLPIHFLQTQPLVFPLDSGYAAHIRCRSSFWEKAVRGSELEGEEYSDDEGVPLREDEADLESPEDLEELYVHELDRSKELAKLEETGGLESGEAELDWLTEDSVEEESVEAFELAEQHHEVDSYVPLDEFDAGPAATVLEERQLPAPKGTELRHFHVKKTLNVAGSLDTAAKASLMKPLEMRPAYIDPWLDTLETDTSATGLQGLLSELMLGRWRNFLSPESVRDKKAHATDRFYVALVDLTGAKLSKPEFAGWAPTEAVDGASIPKILAHYALFQLRFDLNHLASANLITKKADLLKLAENHWKSTGLAGWPSPGQLFSFVEEAGKPVQVKFQRWLDAAQFDINGNCSVTRLMNGLGFDYIGSVALQSDLRHPARGGLWLGTTYECGDTKSTRWRRDLVPLIASCVAGGQSGHHITALSAATYYTLLAQGRLVDEPNSRELMTRLRRGCSLSPGGFRNGLRVLGGVTRTAQKCGLLRKCTHESMFVERDRFRYVAVALAKGGNVPFDLLIQDLDMIIQKRNP